MMKPPAAALAQPTRLAYCIRVRRRSCCCSGFFRQSFCEPVMPVACVRLPVVCEQVKERESVHFCSLAHTKPHHFAIDTFGYRSMMTSDQADRQTSRTHTQIRWRCGIFLDIVSCVAPVPPGTGIAAVPVAYSEREHLRVVFVMLDDGAISSSSPLPCGSLVCWTNQLAADALCRILSDRQTAGQSLALLQNGKHLNGLATFICTMAVAARRLQWPHKRLLSVSGQRGASISPWTRHSLLHLARDEPPRRSEKK